jgi:ankyrin repeat protein
LRAAEGGLTTLTAAVAKNLPKVVEKLLTVVDKDYINKKSDQGITPLLFAANQVCLSHTAHSV